MPKERFRKIIIVRVISAFYTRKEKSATCQILLKKYILKKRKQSRKQMTSPPRILLVRMIIMTSKLREALAATIQLLWN